VGRWWLVSHHQERAKWQQQRDGRLENTTSQQLIKHRFQAESIITADPPTCPHTDAHAALEGRNKFIPKWAFDSISERETTKNRHCHQNRTSHGTSKDRFPRHVSIFLSFPFAPFGFVSFSRVPTGHQTIHSSRHQMTAPGWFSRVHVRQNTCRTTRWVPGSRKGAKRTVQKCAELNALATTVKDAHPPPYPTPSGCHYLKTPFIIPFFISVCYPYLLATKSTLITICRSRKAESATMTPPSDIRCQAPADSGF
jgi:hypothetical protein